MLALAPASIDIESGVVGLEALKRRKRGMIRQVPLPPDLLDELNQAFRLRDTQRDPQLANLRIWRFSRRTAWRHVKAVTAAAGIMGTPAKPKGLGNLHRGRRPGTTCVRDADVGQGGAEFAGR